MVTKRRMQTHTATCIVATVAWVGLVSLPIPSAYATPALAWIPLSLATGWMLWRGWRFQRSRLRWRAQQENTSHAMTSEALEAWYGHN